MGLQIYIYLMRIGQFYDSLVRSKIMEPFSRSFTLVSKTEDLGELQYTDAELFDIGNNRKEIIAFCVKNALYGKLCTPYMTFSWIPSFNKKEIEEVSISNSGRELYKNKELANLIADTSKRPVTAEEIQPFLKEFYKNPPKEFL